MVFLQNIQIRSTEMNRESTKSYLKTLAFSNVEDTHWEKAPSNKPPALAKSMNIGIWVVGASNQLFLKGS